MTLHLAAWIAAISGTGLTLWLLWSLWHEAKRQQTPRYQSHTWLVDEQRESLKAAAMTDLFIASGGTGYLYKGSRWPSPGESVVVVPGKGDYRIVLDDSAVGYHYEAETT